MKKFLIVVDMQNDFIDGALGTAEAVAIVPRVLEKIRQYLPGQVIATRDTHQKDYLATSEGKYLPVEHCIQGTKGWELQTEIREALAGAKVIDKPVFGSVKLTEYMAALAGADVAGFCGRRTEAVDTGRESLGTVETAGRGMEIELVGLCTDICVVANALLLKTVLPEAVIRVDGSCCAGVTPESHDAALLTMKMCQVEII